MRDGRALRVVIGEDSFLAREAIGALLESTAGIDLVAVCEDADSLRSAIEREEPDVVLTDIRMPGGGGMELLARAVELDARRAVVLMTGYGTVEQAVEAMRIGAAHYVQKPFRNEAVVALVERFGRERALTAENERLRAELRASTGMGEMVASSVVMQAVFKRIATVAPTDATGPSRTPGDPKITSQHRCPGRS